MSADAVLQQPPGIAAEVAATVDAVGQEQVAAAAPDATTPRIDMPGVFVPQTKTFFLNDQQSGGDAEHAVVYGADGMESSELIGDWNGDGLDTPGMYDPATGTFYLTNELTGGEAAPTFHFGPTEQNLIPLVGNWDGDGDGTDGIGLYDPATSTFFLTNSFTPGVTDETVQFGMGGLGWLPIIGNWDGHLGDSLGLYEPATSMFFLKNNHTCGYADEAFQFGVANLGWVPLAGNWDGTPGDGVGFYVPQTAQWFLQNTHVGGPAETTFVYGIGDAGWRPVVGHWQSTEPAASPAATSAPALSPVGVDRVDLVALATQQIQAAGPNADVDPLFLTPSDRRWRSLSQR